MDFLKLADDGLRKIFDEVKADPTKLRNAFVKRVDAASERFGTGEMRGRKEYTISNGVVEYRPTLGGAPVKLDGKRDAYLVPAERFLDFLAGVKASVEAGELDKALEAADGAPVVRNVTRSIKSDGGDKPARAGWSEERRAKFAASVAARKAKKGG